MTKYLLVSFKTCPWVQRAAIVLREKNIPFEFRHIEPDNRPDWFLAISPHKKVPVLRAINRAWTDYVPTFASSVTATGYAEDETAYKAAAGKIPGAFERLELALEKQGAGPFFNGTKYSLVDAAYAPFLQRYVFLDRVKPLGIIEKFPRLKAWAETLMKRSSTHSFPEGEFEAMYRANLKRRKVYASQFIADAAIAAE